MIKYNVNDRVYISPQTIERTINDPSYYIFKRLYDHDIAGTVFNTIPNNNKVVVSFDDGTLLIVNNTWLDPHDSNVIEFCK